jgi:hypothetical protein
VWANPDAAADDALRLKLIEEALAFVRTLPAK